MDEIFRSAIEASPDGFWLIDRDGRLLAVNAAYERLSGYSRDELLGMGVPDLDVRETPEETAAHIEKLLYKGSDLFDTLHRRKDGTVWAAEISTTVSPEQDGSLFVTIRDVVRRKRSEALLVARQKFADLAENGSYDQLMQAALDEAELFTGSSIGFFHFVDADQEHLLLQAWSTNTLKTMCKVAGRGMHYPISSAGVWVDCFHERRPVIHNDYANLPHRKGLPEGHAPVTRELVVPILRGEKVVAILGVGNKTSDYTRDDAEVVQEIASLVIDLVERNRLDQALRRNERELRLITDSVPALIAYIDAEFRYRRANHLHEIVFALPMEKIVGATVREVIGDGAWEELQPFMRQVLEGKEVAFEVELPWRDTRRWVQATYTPDRDAVGRVRGFVAHILNIDRQKRLEEQAIHSAQTLAVGELALGVGHEINNPLTGIINCAQILIDRKAVVDDGNLRFLEGIIRDGKRVAEVIKGLMVFSRAGSEKKELILLDRLVQDVLLLLRKRLEKERIILEVVTAETPLHVMVNPPQLEQVVHHLLSNARYALQERRQQDARPLRLTITMEKAEAACCRVRVRDNGTGIPPEILGKVGRMFFTSKPAGSGAGLGLSISRQIVEKHGGSLVIASVAGDFTEVTVELPLAGETGRAGG